MAINNYGWCTGRVPGGLVAGAGCMGGDEQLPDLQVGDEVGLPPRLLYEGGPSNDGWYIGGFSGGLAGGAGCMGGNEDYGVALNLGLLLLDPLLICAKGCSLILL